MRENTFEEKENLLDNNTNEGYIQQTISNEKERNTNGNNDENIKNSEKLTEENVKPSAGNEVVIEDNIKTTDTLEFINKKKKENKNNENNENDDFDSDKGNKKNNKKKKNNYKYHIYINIKFLKYFTLVAIIIYIFIIIASSIVFHQRRESNPFLFCFKFIDRVPAQSQGLDNKDKEIIYFLTDLNSFYIIHLVLFIIFISVCYLLIKGSDSRIDYFFNNMSIFFVSTLIFNIPILFSGMFTDHFYGNHLQPVVYLILTFLGFLCMVKIYIVAKKHKYKKISSLINISILSSFMTAYQCYCFLFNITYFYMNFFKPKVEETKHKEYPEVEIIAGCVYFALGIVVMTVFKDIFFVIAMVIIEIGLLYSKRKNDYLLTIALVNISIVSLNFASVIILIFVYNKKIFKLKEKK